MISKQQMREAILDALSGRIQPPVSIFFDNYRELKIGVRIALERKALLQPHSQPPTFLADAALSSENESVYKLAFEELKSEGIILQDANSSGIAFAPLPAPFVSQWAFLELLRGGGQGSTRKVRRIKDGVEGVLKLPLLEGEVPTKRFKSEVEILQSIEHSAIVRLLDFNLDSNQGSLGYVTPLGIPLDHYWEEKSASLTSKERYDLAYNIIRVLAEGLERLHAASVVHRDLKPENVVLIESTPVIIDFGVAYRPNNNRLTDLDGRPIANNFATPPSAHYGLHADVPAWDCLGLAWIYGFLIGEGRRPKQFHWKFHPLVDEPRKERARALLAACANEETVPKTAKDFSALVEKIGLSGAAPQMHEPNSQRIDEASKTFLDAQAATMQQRASDADLAEVSIQIATITLTELRNALNARCVGNDILTVTRNSFTETDDFPSSIRPQVSMEQILKQIFRNYRDGYYAREYIFSCRCGSTRRFFDILAYVEYSKNHIEDGLRFILGLKCQISDQTTPEWPEYIYWLGKDASLFQPDIEKIFSPAELADVAFHFMTDPWRWEAIA